jgi:hypothetical protein
MEIQEERVSNTPWQIRCTAEQKRFFQKFVESTGLNASEAVLKAFESFQIQSEDENNESKKILLEADILVSRLQTMIRSQLVTALEKQKQCDEERNLLEKEKDKYQFFYDETLNKVKFEFEEERTSLINKLQEESNNIKSRYELKEKESEKEFITLKEHCEILESKLQLIEREKASIQKQYSESLRLYELTDENLLEQKIKVKNLESKLNDYNNLKNKVFDLDKENSALKMKMDYLLKEETLKREALEKDLKRDFEIECMKLKQDFHIEQRQ